jgi:phage shock protein PspC (stress-responsive transcriptional regulator)
MKMRKVTTVNLNGNAYQLEDAAFDSLRAYLDGAAAKLRANPDRAEILADLEQAIGDKCDTCLGAHKNVVSQQEMEQILREMGPVEGVAPDEGSVPGDAPPAPGATAAPGTGQPRRKRLYRLPTEGMMGGVCAGIAAYVNVDVVWIRLAFILLTFSTGVWFFVWLAMLCVMPVADTPEEIAAAHGEPLNAREVIERAKKKSAEFVDGARARMQPEWERFGSDMKDAGERVAAGFADAGQNASQSAREFSHRLRERARRRAASRDRHQRPVSPGIRLLAGLSLPILSLISALLFVGFVFAVLSLLTQGHILGFMPLPGIPLWLALLAIAIVYFAIGGPVGAARRMSQRQANGGRSFGWASSTDGLLWVLLVALFFYLAWQYAPSLREWAQAIPVINI